MEQRIVLAQQQILARNREINQPELKSSPDKIFGWVAERKGPLK
jgi:hypothetical protein